jgi:hypothetical protein
MFCANCGTRLPDDASFCVKCGKPQRPGAQPLQQQPQWERCQIEWDDLGGFLTRSARFWADAIGPKGSYNAGTSREFGLSFFEGHDPRPEPYDKNHVAALTELVGKLVREGWEPSETQGPAWFSHRFQRRVK